MAVLLDRATLFKIGKSSFHLSLMLSVTRILIIWVPRQISEKVNKGGVELLKALTKVLHEIWCCWNANLRHLDPLPDFI